MPPPARPRTCAPLHRAELQVFAEGVADIMRRDPSPTQRLKGYKAEAALRSPWLRALLERMKIEHCYSAYYLPCRWRNVGLVCRVDEARRANAPPVRQAGLGRVLFTAGQNETRLKTRVDARCNVY